jgi:DNA modification methylase
MSKQELLALVDELYRDLKDKTTVLYEKKPMRSDYHPTMKPVTLVGRLMRNSSRVNDLVVDLFGGSGSTLIAAEQLKRRAFLMELDERFCDVIVKRWEEFTGEKAVKIE